MKGALHHGLSQTSSQDKYEDPKQAMQKHRQIALTCPLATVQNLNIDQSLHGFKPELCSKTLIDPLIDPSY